MFAISQPILLAWFQINTCQRQCHFKLWMYFWNTCLNSPDKVNKQHMYSYTTEEHILGHPFDWWALLLRSFLCRISLSIFVIFYHLCIVSNEFTKCPKMQKNVIKKTEFRGAILWNSSLPWGATWMPPFVPGR